MKHALSSSASCWMNFLFAMWLLAHCMNNVREKFCFSGFPSDVLWLLCLNYWVFSWTDDFVAEVTVVMGVLCVWIGHMKRLLLCVISSKFCQTADFHTFAFVQFTSVYLHFWKKHRQQTQLLSKTTYTVWLCHGSVQYLFVIYMDHQTVTVTQSYAIYLKWTTRCLATQWWMKYLDH